LGDNRSLQSLDLSFNNLLEKAELCSDRGGPANSEEVLHMEESDIKKGMEEALN
jgi:hypothetical protein